MVRIYMTPTIKDYHSQDSGSLGSLTSYSSNKVFNYNILEGFLAERAGLGANVLWGVSYCFITMCMFWQHGRMPITDKLPNIQARAIWSDLNQTVLWRFTPPGG
jgi:hypothetical protein